MVLIFKQNLSSDHFHLVPPFFKKRFLNGKQAILSLQIIQYVPAHENFRTVIAFLPKKSIVVSFLLMWPYRIAVGLVMGV